MPHRKNFIPRCCSEIRDGKADALVPQQSALMTAQRLHRDSTRGAGPERRHDLLVVARPEMCEAGREQSARATSAGTGI